MLAVALWVYELHVMITLRNFMYDYQCVSLLEGIIKCKMCDLYVFSFFVDVTFSAGGETNPAARSWRWVSVNYFLGISTAAFY